MQLCHTVFANGNEAVAINEVKKACEQLMRQGESCVLHNYQCQGAIIEHDLKADNNIKKYLQKHVFHKMSSPSFFSNVLETDRRVERFTIGIISVNQKANMWQPILTCPLFSC